MIEHAEFRNFKGLLDVKMDFERFTMLVGPNASGKTSILQGLRAVSGLRKEMPSDPFRFSVAPVWLFTRRGR